MYLITLLCLILFTGVRSENALNIFHLKPCCNASRCLTYYEDYTLDTVGDLEYRVSGIVHIKEELTPPLKAVFNIIKCRDRTKPSTCETFATEEMPNVCPEIELPTGKGYSTFLQAGFPTKCPIKKGVYQITPYIIEMPGVYLELMKQGRYWKMTSMVYHKDRLAYCLYGEGSVETRERGRKFIF